VAALLFLYTLKVFFDLFNVQKSKEELFSLRVFCSLRVLVKRSVAPGQKKEVAAEVDVLFLELFWKEGKDTGQMSRSLLIIKR